MLRQERKPINKSEQMILNNYNTIKKLNEIKGEKLTIELILEIIKNFFNIRIRYTISSPGKSREGSAENRRKPSVAMNPVFAEAGKNTKSAVKSTVTC